MYNKERKEAFINDSKYDFTDSVKAFLTSIFTKAYEIENTQGIDLASFNHEQVVILLKWHNSTSREVLRLICSYYEKYYDWCVTNGHAEKYNIQTPYDYSILSQAIESIVTVKMVSEKYYSKKEFIKMIDRVYDNSAKFIMYSIFLNCFGEKGQSLSKIKITDIDIINKTVILDTGRIVKVDQKFIDLAIVANEDKCYLQDENSLLNVRQNNMYYESIYILKGCKSRHHTEVVQYSTMAARISKAKEQIGNPHVAPVNILFNGMINAIKEKLSEIGVTLEEAMEVNEISTREKSPYKEEIEKILSEFGYKIKFGELKYKIKDFLDCYND